MPFRSCSSQQRQPRVRQTFCAAGPDTKEEKRAAADGQPASAPGETPAAQLKRNRQRKGKPKGKSKTVSLTLRRTPEEAEAEAESFTLDDLNPIAIGKRSRQVRTAGRP